MTQNEFEKSLKIKLLKRLCSFFEWALQYLKKIAHEKWNTQIDFFSLLPWAAQTAQTEEFMFKMWLINQLYIKLGPQRTLVGGYVVVK